MKVTKKDLEKSQVELTVELTIEEFKPYIPKGAEKVSQEVKIEGFRPGKAPFDIIKNKVGEMTILEEAAKIAIDKTIESAVKENEKRQLIGQPQINITKLAPENPLEYKIILIIIPEVTLTDYKNIKVKSKTVELKDEEVEKMINELKEMRVKEVISDKPATEGGKLLADIEMFLDNVPVEGGQGKGTNIILGKDYVIPGFDKNLIGAKKGETKEFKLPYPEEHHQKNLAGKMVDFRVKINEVYDRQLPELDEEFVKNFGLKSVDELKTNIKKSLTTEKEQKEQNRCERELLDKLIEKSKFSEIPESLIEHESRVMVSEFEYGMEKQGGKFDDYLSHIGKTRDQFVLELLPEAIKRVKSSLAIKKIAEAEKLGVTKEEIDKAVEDLIKQFQGKEKDLESKVNNPAYREYLENSMASRKVIDKLKSWNVEK